MYPESKYILLPVQSPLWSKPLLALTGIIATVILFLIKLVTSSPGSFSVCSVQQLENLLLASARSHYFSTQGPAVTFCLNQRKSQCPYSGPEGCSWPDPCYFSNFISASLCYPTPLALHWPEAEPRPEPGEKLLGMFSHLMWRLDARTMSCSQGRHLTCLQFGGLIGSQVNWMPKFIVRSQHC